MRGFDATSVDAIAERAGLTVGALYRHFKTKGELLLDVIRRALTSLPIARHMRGDSARPDLLPEMVQLYMAPASRKLRRLVIELHTAASRDPRVARLFRDSASAWPATPARESSPDCAMDRWSPISIRTFRRGS